MYTLLKYTRICLLLLALVLVLPSCKTLKKGKGSVKNSLNFVETKMLENSFAPEWFAGKMKLKFRQNDAKQQSVNVAVRMKKDETIWMSVDLAFGIEIARVLITPDQVKIMDRFHKDYYEKDFEYLRQFIDYPLDFNTLQAMIYGQIIKNSDFNAIRTVGDQYRLNSEDCTVFLDTNEFNIIQMIMEDVAREQSFIANYEGYERLDGKNFSNKRNYLMKSTDNYTVNIQFSKVKVNEKQEFPFKVSSKYKKVD